MTTSITSTVTNYLIEQKLTRGKIRVIAKATKLPLPWLYKVASKKIPNPQADRVFVLYNYIQKELKDAA